MTYCCPVVQSRLTLRPHGLQHVRFPCPSPSPRACSNSCPLSWWCHPTILSSVAPFSCPQSFPASRSFPVSWLFTSGGQNIIRASTSTSVLPMNIKGWFPQDWLVWSLCCPRESQKSSPTPQFESINSLALSHLDGPTLTSVLDYWEKKKKHSLTTETFVCKMMSLLFNMLSRFAIAVLPRCNRLLIS